MTIPPGSKGTILIVDDEPNVLWFISKVCQPRGYETLTAGNGLEGLKYVQECGEKIDLVLLDLKMPGMGGVEVLKSIRKHHPELPVIILTAMHDKKQECEALGIESFIKKPYSLEDLYAHIESIMERKSLDKTDLQIPAGAEPSAKILIVDNDHEVRELLSEALFEDVENAYFKVKGVETGEEALKESLVFQPDIAIVSIKLAGMWGDELVRRFKEGEGHCPRDFVIYTNPMEPQEAERAKKMGHKYLSKSANIEALFEILKKICVRHNLLHKKDSAE